MKKRTISTKRMKDTKIEQERILEEIKDSSNWALPDGWTIYAEIMSHINRLNKFTFWRHVSDLRIRGEVESINDSEKIAEIWKKRGSKPDGLVRATDWEKYAKGVEEEK
jgi:hypothetical protein